MFKFVNRVKKELFLIATMFMMQYNAAFAETKTLKSLTSDKFTTIWGDAVWIVTIVGGGLLALRIKSGHAALSGASQDNAAEVKKAKNHLILLYVSLALFLGTDILVSYFAGLFGSLDPTIKL